MIDSQLVFDQVENILFETMAENLDSASVRLVSENPSALCLEIHEHMDESWFELIPDQLEDEDWLELGVYFEKKPSNALLARVLFNLDMEEEKACHIQWFNIY